MNGLPPAPPNDSNFKKRKASGTSAPKKRGRKQDDSNPSAPGTDSSAAAAGSAPKKPRQKKAASGVDGKAAGGKGKGKDKADEEVFKELVNREDGAVEDEPEENLGKNHSGVFSKDLPWLMYGFGDDDKPLKETVDLVEDIAVQFITDTVHAAMTSAAARNPGTYGSSSSSSSAAAKKDEIRLEDLLFAVRRDPRKVARIQELIRRQQEIKEARKVLAGDEEGVEDMADM